MHLCLSRVYRCLGKPEQGIGTLEMDFQLFAAQCGHWVSNIGPMEGKLEQKVLLTTEPDQPHQHYTHVTHLLRMMLFFFERYGFYTSFLRGYFYTFFLFGFCFSL